MENMWDLLNQGRTREFREEVLNFLIDKEHMWCKHKVNTTLHCLIDQELMSHMIILFELKQYNEGIQLLVDRMHQQLRQCVAWFDFLAPISLSECSILKYHSELPIVENRFKEIYTSQAS